MTRDRLGILIILCSNYCGRESIRLRQAMRIAMTASRSVEIRRFGWLWEKSMKAEPANPH